MAALGGGRRLSARQGGPSHSLHVGTGAGPTAQGAELSLRPAPRREGAPVFVAGSRGPWPEAADGRPRRRRPPQGCLSAARGGPFALARPYGLVDFALGVDVQ